MRKNFMFALVLAGLAVGCKKEKEIAPVIPPVIRIIDTVSIGTPLWISDATASVRSVNNQEIPGYPNLPYSNTKAVEFTVTYTLHSRLDITFSMDQSLLVKYPNSNYATYSKGLQIVSAGTGQQGENYWKFMTKVMVIRDAGAAKSQMAASVQNFYYFAQADGQMTPKVLPVNLTTGSINF